LGFTLIELMLVVAIIGLLAAIAIPKFANLVTKTKESALRGKMGTIRSALSLYYADHDGEYIAWPGDLVPKYLEEMPTLSVPTVPAHVPYPLPCAGPTIVSCFADGMWTPLGGYSWVYEWTTGQMAINCSHMDTKGTTWSLY